ncbi:hypothetical protein [Exiguobacterium sp. s163]|uniref:hypothetical protein n=1 Tax=Exiguobacterium sp. s163 TaxID=2751287 RepID=UPI001BE9407D|nr:hypothetical protein [Exiguobacterium sp. s163]
MSNQALEKENQKKMVELVDAFLKNKEMYELELGGTGISPYQLKKYLTERGYRETSFETNGWEWDFVIMMENGQEEELMLSGQGFTFDLKLERTEL